MKQQGIFFALFGIGHGGSRYFWIPALRFASAGIRSTTARSLPTFTTEFALDAKSRFMERGDGVLEPLPDRLIGIDGAEEMN